MPVSKKQSTTLHSAPKAMEQAASPLPDQHPFHHSLPEQIRGAVRVVMEELMNEELTLFLGAAWGECSPERKGYRNGTSTRDLATTAGPIEDLKVRRRS